MTRRKAPQAVPSAENPSDIEARADRLEAAMKREEKALKKLAELRARREEMGMEPPAVTDSPDFDNGFPPEGPQIPEATRLERILAELGTEGSFEVLRKDGMDWTSVGIYELSEYPEKLQEIAKECGGGKFQIKFKNEGGQWAGQVTRSFDSKFFAKSSAPAAPATDSTVVLLEMQKLMMQAQESNKRDLMELMKTMVAANNRPNPLLQSASDVAAMQQAFGGGKSSVDPLAMTSAILKAAQELKDMTEGKLPVEDDADGQKPGGDFFKLVMDGILKAVAGKAALPTPVTASPSVPTVLPMPSGQAPTALPAAAPVLPAGPTPAAPSEEVHPLLRFKTHPLVALYAPVLVDFAQKNTDPLLVSEVVMERIPEGFDAIVLDIVGRPDFFEVLCQYDPRLRPHQVWCSQVVSALKESLGGSQGEAGAEVEQVPALVPASEGVSPNGGKPAEGVTDAVRPQGDAPAGS